MSTAIDLIETIMQVAAKAPDDSTAASFPVVISIAKITISGLTITTVDARLQRNNNS